MRLFVVVCNGDIEQYTQQIMQQEVMLINNSLDLNYENGKMHFAVVAKISVLNFELDWIGFTLLSEWSEI